MLAVCWLLSILNGRKMGGGVPFGYTGLLERSHRRSMIMGGNLHGGLLGVTKNTQPIPPPRTRGEDSTKSKIKRTWL